MEAHDAPDVVLRQMIDGYQVSQALSTAAYLGIADLLASRGRTAADLAPELGVDEDALHRLLSALTGIGVLSCSDDGTFHLDTLGVPLRTDVPNSLAGWAVFIGSPAHWQAWGALRYSVETGQSAFMHVHGADTWAYRSARPAESALFDRAMSSNSSTVAASVIEAFDFGRFATIVDVGGGNGRFIGEVLAANPDCRGIVFDRPHVVAGAAPVLEALGVADRCGTVGGDFFDSVPAGSDAYILKSILHDWDDEECRSILRAVRVSMSDGASILIVERELGTPNQKPMARFSDLNMLVGPGGRERTIAEYSTLLADSGFRQAGIASSSVGLAVIHAIAN